MTCHPHRHKAMPDPPPRTSSSQRSRHVHHHPTEGAATQTDEECTRLTGLVRVNAWPSNEYKCMQSNKAPLFPRIMEYFWLTNRRQLIRAHGLPTPPEEVEKTVPFDCQENLEHYQHKQKVNSQKSCLFQTAWLV